MGIYSKLNNSDLIEGLRLHADGKLPEDPTLLYEVMREAADRLAAASFINRLCVDVHEANAKWWTDIKTGAPIKRNVGELLMLAVSELAEALEGDRKNLADDKLPHRPMFEVELADCIIRIFDMAGGLGIDLGGAYEDKMAFNARRHDHTIEGRKQADGKKY